jgi:hypothetical protein
MVRLQTQPQRCQACNEAFIFGRTGLNMSTRHNLIEPVNDNLLSFNESLRTEVVIDRTPALPLDVAPALRAMLVWIVPIADILEEVNLVPVREQCSSN